MTAVDRSRSLWWAKTFHRFPEELQCRFAIPALGDIAFQHLTFVVHSSLEVVGFTVDLHEGCCQTNANSSQFPGIGNLLGCADAAPLGKSGGAVELEI